MHTSEGSGGHAGFHEALIGMGIFLGPAIVALAGGGGGNVGPGLEQPAAALTRIGYSVAAVLTLGALVMWIMVAGKDRKLVTADPNREERP